MSRMTTEPRPRRGGSPALAVAAVSAAAFLTLLGALAKQLAGGRDPALGAPAAAQSRPPKRVLVRRIEEKVVVTRVIPSQRARSGGSTSPAPVLSEPAPAPVATPAPAPAPAPPPAPVTRSS